MDQKPDLSYFGMQSSWGVTKHPGGKRATDELVEMCHIGPGSYVLVVGCGVGATPCHLAQKHGCRVMGVDLSAKMVEWASKRVQGSKLQDHVECRVADAQALPFDDATFDAVIGESVNAFIPDRPKAAGEYVRVTKLGGYVGFNECAWVETPPQELLEYVRFAMDNPAFLPPDGWRDLLTGAQLADVTMQVRRMSMMRQRLDELGELDGRDLAERLRAAWRLTVMAFKDPQSRQYIKSMVPSGVVIKNLFKCLGYVMCAGKK
ncbi:MAG: methyltransferase domain-containing protein [Anaerolineae bacterium]|nr:methyltransferase domain-containing protein [Anaerolineae bacterium]